jgi:DNA-binding response OmpR family regulator
LCQNINQNISYDYLKESIWAQKDISDSTLRDTISRLKKKIPHITIENIVNYGYVLKQYQED